jgi:hypothetical protein
MTLSEELEQNELIFRNGVRTVKSDQVIYSMNIDGKNVAIQIRMADEPHILRELNHQQPK